MKHINRLLIALVLSIGLFFTGCEDRSDLTAPKPTPAPSTGSADFTTFVSIGNSLTQGEQSGSVYSSAQEYSFTNLIAKQVQTDFVYANFPDPGSGGRLEVASLEPFSTYTNPDATAPSNLTYAAPYNNLGVKGAFLWDVLNTTNAADCYTATQLTAYGVSVENPMFNAVLRGQGTMMQQALAQNPTFMTLWIGNNDVLAYATRGGLFPPTPPANFQAMYQAIITQLATAGVDVVVANIPDVLSVPFFNTVGPQLLAQGITAVVGTKADGSVAPLDLTKNLLLLTASAELAAGKGLSAENPLSNGVILDESEITNTKALVDGYNDIIAAICAGAGYAVVDINSFFTDISQNGYSANGIDFTATYVSGGLFSLDGVHPTSAGYAVVANEFIKVINEKYNASIPLIDLSTIPPSLIFAESQAAGKITGTSFDANAFERILF
ncbi:MAG: hypothetical protein K9J16_02810 [Melioribacteraceae bacterium]|nr:hypothetical protein [Melioribacteraceae bacterium]MCF8352939.1 hypothetical protein [Melioribacteraceae bacterium]MCF8395875.1 hypothetical protein [Melioribacteraceae bacterium]MCF8417456.1 hypothetical protein [Melioribacteraceae bacterium]